MLRNLIALILMGLMGLVAYVVSVTQDLPPVEKVLKDGVNPTQWTQVLAANGTPIMSFGKFHHENVRLKNVSHHFVDALIATEDRRFYEHHGVDPVAVTRAIVSDLTQKRLREGGSTITQQLARNIFLNSERSMARKIKEAALAMQLEDKLSKDQILELYVNNIYFGEGAYGIKAASEVYFGKPPAQLTVPEAALLAGLPQAPSGYSPYQNVQAAKNRRDEVLQNLVEVGKITPAQLAVYKARPIRLSPGSRNLASSDKAPFFNRYVLQQVMRYFNLDEQSFWQSGLKIYTTLDINAQGLAENAVYRQSLVYGRTRAAQQAALVSINPNSGAILAYVGGKNYQQSQFDRVTGAVRSPGSLFKIFTYTAAVDHGYEPNRVYLDEPMSIGDWRPQNYDKSHHGYLTLARALITSNNIVAVKVISELGADTVVSMAQQMGIHTPLEPYLGLTLGGSGVKLMDITSAFGVLANQGVRVEPYAIDRIVDDGGHEIYKEHPVKTNVLNRTTVDTMINMMTGVVQRGTGRAAAIGRPVAGKTGTSDDYRDAWFVGFTPDVVTGVWVGNDNNSTMPGMTGGSLPASIWRSFMQPYMANRPVKNFDLAYSRALNEADFVSFNLNNLSDKENGHVNPDAIQQDNGQDPDLINPVNPIAGENPPPEAPMAPDAPVAPEDVNPGNYNRGRGLDPMAAPAPEASPDASRGTSMRAMPPTGPDNSAPQPMPGYSADPNAPRAGYAPPMERARKSRIDPTEPVGRY